MTFLSAMSILGMDTKFFFIFSQHPYGHSCDEYICTLYKKFLFHFFFVAVGKSWIGLNDMDVEEVWRWAGSNQLLGRYVNWDCNQPDGYHYHNCAYLTNNTKWNDWLCDEHKWAYLCEL
jgi:hypothetical protein